MWFPGQLKAAGTLDIASDCVKDYIFEMQRKMYR